MLAISFIVYIILLYLAYAYLRGLKTCACVQPVYVENLMTAELMLLGFNLVGLLFSLISSMHILPILKTYKAYLLKFVAVTSLAMLSFYAYFLYNAYFFHSTMAPNCACANTWEKYYIYLQAAATALIIISTAVFSGYAAFTRLPAQDIGEKLISSMLDSAEEVVGASARKVKSIGQSAMKSAMKTAKKTAVK